MVYRNGRAKLNFEQFRKQYEEKLKEYDTSNHEEFFNLRKGPIKEIVNHFATILTDYVAQ